MQKKGLGRTIYEEAEIMRKTWKGQANSWRKRPLAFFHEGTMLQKSYRYFLHLT
jgi:hypothetical protein